MQNYGKIAVLAGGPSSEREISLKSGEAVYRAIKKRHGNTELVDFGGEFRQNIPRLAADVAFIALHGRFGEDGTIQAMLEKAGIPYTGSGVEASKLALDKLESRRLFEKNGIRIPRFMVIKPDYNPRDLLDEFKIPFVVKPRYEGSSIGLTVVNDEKGLEPAFKKAFKYGDDVLIEDYLYGREVTVGILEGRALPVIEIISKDKVYDYSAKYVDRETRYIVPADLSGDDYGKAQEIALKAHNALDCRDFSRVDMRMDEEGEIFVLEVNTIPGMTERSLLPKAAAAAGIGFEELCMRLLELAYKRRRDDG